MAVLSGITFLSIECALVVLRYQLPALSLYHFCEHLIAIREYDNVICCGHNIDLSLKAFLWSYAFLTYNSSLGYIKYFDPQVIIKLD